MEIKTFARSEDEKVSTFTLEFLVRNESQQGISLQLVDYVRLIADDIPYSPTSVSPTYVEARLESAEFGTVTFKVRGRPQTAYVRFGTAATGRGLLRWPD